LEEKQFRADFVMLDLNLPKFSGHAILERCKFASGPPIVVFTASQSEEDRQRALAEGAKDYVVKPVEFLPFIEAVKDILQRWGRAYKGSE
jgi:DNA-binding response OmpR family regulator